MGTSTGFPDRAEEVFGGEAPAELPGWPLGVKLLSGVPLPVPGSVHGADCIGAFPLTSTVALRLAISRAA